MVKAFICGCAGPALSDEERLFIAEAQPWGLILFKRNVVEPAQMRRLTQLFRALVGRPDAPVLIDQEGGRVQRMAPPHWPAYPSAASFESSGKDRGAALTAARLTARLIAHDLRDIGITIDCAPVLDLSFKGAHSVIGSRAFSDDPARVAEFGRAVADGLMAGAVAPVVKHMPGHGRAMVDSHLDLPIVEASRADLAAADFAPFVALKDLPIAMTAHVVYRAIDPDRPATTSKIVVETIIRGAIGFDGLLLTDDLSMKALGGSFEARTQAAFAAGVDIALHCNGDLAEATAVAKAAPVLAGRALRRAETALATTAAAPQPFDIGAARAELAAFAPAA
ncbi:MAG TPA: beta-N-acetylhexosaminidase [Roseiarcus sp.]|nr:beta-N-acetylhexosaminidase [Roseiarcus sp.]